MLGTGKCQNSIKGKCLRFSLLINITLLKVLQMRGTSTELRSFWVHHPLKQRLERVNKNLYLYTVHKSEFPYFPIYFLMSNSFPSRHFSHSMWYLGAFCGITLYILSFKVPVWSVWDYWDSSVPVTHFSSPVGAAFSSAWDGERPGIQLSLVE